MVNILLAYDDNDMRLGDYFQKSYEHISNWVSMNPDVVVNALRGLDCTELNVNSHIATYNGDRFIFAGLSHGNEDALCTSNDNYASLANSSSFHNSFFYTCACLTADVLGGDLINKGCLVYIGYDSVVYVPESHFEVFIKCENFALGTFVTSGKHIGACFREMNELYNAEIDKLVIGNDIIAASLLNESKDSLVILGDQNLTINDFRI